MFHRATDWIVDRPRLPLVLLLLISSVATLGHVAPERVLTLFAPPAEIEEDASSVPDEVSERPPDVDPFSLSDAHAIVVAESDIFFTPTGARAMRHVVQQLESLGYVERVLWMDRVPILNIFGLPEPLFPRSQASAQRFEAAREKALQHPLIVGQLLSADGKTLLLMVHLDFFFMQDDDDCIGGLRSAAEKAAAEFDANISFSVTGRVPMYVTAMKSHEENQHKYQLIGYGMIALMSLILFRGIIAVIIVAMAPALGVFWTLGVLRYFELQHNPFNDVILPVLLSLVGLTDGVHLMVHIRRERAAGKSPAEAARAGIRQVGLACGLTSLTTAIGFGSLALAHHETVREFGWCCVIGVLFTFVAVITSIPLACSTWLGRRVHIGQEKSVIDRHLGRLSEVVDYVLHRKTTFSALGIVATALLALAASTLRPDERNSNVLPTRSEPAVALAKMDKAMGGLEFGYVDIRWASDIDSESRDVLDVIQHVDDLLRSEPLIGHPLSIRNLIDALPGDGQAADRMSMLELLPPPLKRAFYTPEYRTAQISFRVQDIGIAKYGPVFERVEAGLASIETDHPKFALELSGSAVWRWRNLYQIVTDLAASLGTASLVIFAVLTLVYRSICIGLISIIPNLFPLAVSAAFLVISGQSLEIVSVCAFTICLGIAVDDTIHFLTRFEEERRQTSDQREAIRRAFTGVGTALIMTTVVLVAGFCTVLFSDSRDHRIFAWMGGITITSALFADMIFLPALLFRFVKRRETGSAQGDDAKVDSAVDGIHR